MRISKWTGAAVALGVVALVGVYAAWSQGYLAEKDDEDEGGSSAQLIQRMQGGTVPLSQGLAASQREGTPISGKFEVEDGNFQLSVYTQKGQDFEEVVLDPKTGTITKTDPITGGDDLASAKAQAQAMARAKKSLTDALQEAEQSHPGARAVSIYPGMQGGQAGADVTLLAGNALQKVPEKLE
jgi:hypothetical protein